MNNDPEMVEKMINIGQGQMRNNRELAKVYIQGYGAILFISIVHIFVIGFTFSVVAANVAALCMVTWSIGNRIHFNRAKFWTLYKGTFVYIGHGDGDEEIVEWVHVNVHEDAFHCLLKSDRMMVFRDSSTAAIVRLMVTY